MKKYNYSTNLSNFYFKTINSYDNHSNWIIIEDNYVKNNVVNFLN